MQNWMWLYRVFFNLAIRLLMVLTYDTRKYTVGFSELKCCSTKVLCLVHDLWLPAPFRSRIIQTLIWWLVLSTFLIGFRHRRKTTTPRTVPTGGASTRSQLRNSGRVGRVTSSDLSIFRAKVMLMALRFMFDDFASRTFAAVRLSESGLS